MVSGWHSGPRYQRWKIEVHERWGFKCHLCGHGGATDADLLTPLAVWPNQPYDPMAARPAHGVRGCPVCGVKCNQSRGAKPLAMPVPAPDQEYERPLD